MKLTGNVHLVQGSETALPVIYAALEKIGIQTKGNPDIDMRIYAQFLVDDARQLVERALTKSISGTRRVFIVVTPNLTYEAQNTMLKTLEEPAGDALFFFVVPAPDALIATVRSRAQIHMSTDASRSDALDAEEFLAATPQMRLDLLKPILAKDDDDVRDISSALTLLSSLERILAKRPLENRAGLEAVYRARKYIGDKGSLIRALLEQVALLTPRM